MRSCAAAFSAIAAIVLPAAVCAPAYADVDSSDIVDVRIHFSDGGAYLIFIDGKGDANTTSGRVAFYRQTTRFRDAPKMVGRGVDQQIVAERVPVETFEPIMAKDFDPSDFQDRKTPAGRSCPVLPVNLPVRGQEVIRIEFGLLRRDVAVDH